jgi:glycosyltransferase involved in cell wall biosynthesis
MKALQYMALAIPPVVSPVGMNATLVEDGVSGLHARDDAGWVEALARLLADPALRARLGAAARRTVEQGYTAEVQVPRVAEILRAAARPG